jgi:hypothetical protein
MHAHEVLPGRRSAFTPGPRNAFSNWTWPIAVTLFPKPRWNACSFRSHAARSGQVSKGWGLGSTSRRNLARSWRHDRCLVYIRSDRLHGSLASGDDSALAFPRPPRALPGRPKSQCRQTPGEPSREQARLRTTSSHPRGGRSFRCLGGDAAWRSPRSQAGARFALGHRRLALRLTAGDGVSVRRNRKGVESVYVRQSRTSTAAKPGRPQIRCQRYLASKTITATASTEARERMVSVRSRMAATLAPGARVGVLTFLEHRPQKWNGQETRPPTRALPEAWTRCA